MDHGVAVVVVLGCQKLDDQPSPLMLERLQKAFSLLQSLPKDTVCVVTGGSPHSYGSTGDTPEGLIMQRWFQQKKNFENVLLLEDKAQNTFHNALFTRSLLKEKKIAVSKLLVVTHDWHGKRSELIFAKVFAKDGLKPEMKLVEVPVTEEVRERLKKEESIIKSGWIENQMNLNKNHVGLQ